MFLVFVGVDMHDWSPLPLCPMACSFAGLCGACCPDWSGLWQLYGGSAEISASLLTGEQISPPGRCECKHTREEEDKKGQDSELPAAQRGWWPDFVCMVAGMRTPVIHAAELGIDRRQKPLGFWLRVWGLIVCVCVLGELGIGLVKKSNKKKGQ